LIGPKIPSVLFLNPWERRIGPNRYLVEMLRNAPGLARKATVVLHEPSDSQEEYQHLGCRVVVWEEIAQIRAGISWGNLYTLGKRHSLGLGRVIRRLGSAHPDLIVSNTEQLVLGDIVARLLGIPHLKIFHAITFAYRLHGRQRAIRAYLRTLTFGTSRIIAVSETQRRALVSGGLANGYVTTVPNPIPVRELGLNSLNPLPSSLRKRLKNTGPVLVNAGRVAPLKGQDQLIEALQAIIRYYPDLLCIFAGQLGSDSGLENTNAYFAALQKRIQELGLTKHVLFVGEIDYLPSLLRRADLYVHTSMMESFCRSVAEALVCGTPVVAFDSGAVPEVAGPGAILITSGDTEACATAVIDLLAQEEKRNLLAGKGRLHIEKYYGAEQVAGSFTDVLMQEFLGRSGAEVNRCAV
jgi:glycosyltransferase involved in cell wall biosynthesis